MRLWDRVMGRAHPEAMVLERAAELLAWSEKRYHAVFLTWLREQADAPVDPRRGHVDLVMATARSNAFREIRSKLIDDVERAHAALEVENAS